MSVTSITYLQKVIKVRRELVRNGRSKKNMMKTLRLMLPIELWLEASPNASHEAGLRIINHYSDDILFLIPGAGCTLHESMIKEFNQLQTEYHELLSH